jgi:hypothetical protein
MQATARRLSVVLATSCVRCLLLRGVRLTRSTPAMNYAELRGHPADFEVRSRILTAEEGGRITGPPWQHCRCDWAYEGDDISQAEIFMIHPEFMLPDGSVFPEGSPVAMTGLATMWILIPEMRAEIHRQRIRLGVRGFFMEGSRRVAEAEVTRIIGLHTNPDATKKPQL